MNRLLKFLLGMTGIVFSLIAGLTTALYAADSPGMQSIWSFFSNEGEDIVGEVETEPISEMTVKPTGKKMNILLLGVDVDGLLTDIMAIVTVDTKNKTLKMLSIPRDTRVKIGSYYQKINTAYSIGKEELAIKTVKSITGMPINYYVVVDIKGFRNIIDILGPIQFDVPQNMKYSDPVQNLNINLQKGMQELDGKKAEQLIRYRSYPMADLQRINVQQDFMRAVIDQKFNTSLILKIDDIYKEIEKNLKTNITFIDGIKHAKSLLDIKKENIQMYQFPGYSKTIGDTSYFILNEQELGKILEEDYGYKVVYSDIK